MARNLNEEFRKVQTAQDKVADSITAFAGSMRFVYLHALIFSAWILYNLLAKENGFDPFPFGLLTLLVSLEAIFLSTFVMLSQNRQNKQADLRAELDYDINVKAEKEVEEIKELLRTNKALLEQHREKMEKDNK